jgi:hypothetical protein
MLASVNESNHPTSQDLSKFWSSTTQATTVTVECTRYRIRFPDSLRKKWFDPLSLWHFVPKLCIHPLRMQTVFQSYLVFSCPPQLFGQNASIFTILIFCFKKWNQAKIQASYERRIFKILDSFYKQVLASTTQRIAAWLDLITYTMSNSILSTDHNEWV